MDDALLCEGRPLFHLGAPQHPGEQIALLREQASYTRELPLPGGCVLTEDVTRRFRSAQAVDHFAHPGLIPLAPVLHGMDERPQPFTVTGGAGIERAAQPGETALEPRPRCLAFVHRVI